MNRILIETQAKVNRLRALRRIIKLKVKARKLRSTLFIAHVDETRTKSRNRLISFYNDDLTTE